MGRPGFLRSRRLEVRAEPASSACWAPSAQIDLRPNGDVRVCCRNEAPLGNIRSQRLRDLWDGARRRAIVDALSRDEFEPGCAHCGAEVAAEGRTGSYPEQFDVHAPHVAAEGDEWPRHMEFTLSINCNLQCAQCSGELSSAIRVHREGRAPLPKAYGDEFFEDIREFVPHLRSASFSGGEPFLAEENFRVWEIIAELAPDLPVTIVTNATQWTPRVEQLLSRLRCSFRLSIDGASAATFESIRVGADFERVRDHVDRFVAYARERGTEVGINHCLVRQNVHEFGDLLLWAEGLGARVFVSVVRNDTRAGSGGDLFSIVRSDPAEVAALVAVLEERDEEMRSRLQLNRQVWIDELERLRSWASLDAAGLRRLWGVGGGSVLMFSAQGDGPTSADGAREDLAAVGEVHEVVWDSDESVVAISPGFAELLGTAQVEALHGGGPRALVAAIESFAGPMAHYGVVSESPDRVDATARFERVDVRVSNVPLRGPDGWATTAVQLLVFTPVDPDAGSGRT